MGVLGPEDRGSNSFYIRFREYDYFSLPGFMALYCVLVACSSLFNLARVGLVC